VKPILIENTVHLTAHWLQTKSSNLPPRRVAIGITLAGALLSSGCTSSSPSNVQRSDARQFANAIVSAMTVQNCPTVFRIKPELRGEFEAVLRTYYKEGSGKVFPRSGESEAECLKRAEEYIAGPQTVRYLELTPAAKQRLQ
jgi:hypothetical protein